MKVNANIIKTYKSLHTWTGIISGMALFIAFYAGALTIFKEPISQWATPPTVSATQLEMDEVPAFIATIVKLAPEAGKSIRLNLDPAEHGTHQFTWIKEDEKAGEHDTSGQRHFTARINNDEEVVTQEIFPAPVAQFIDTLHRVVGLPVDSDANRWIMGVFAGLYTLALVSGLVILLPILVKELFAFRLGRKPKRVWLDAHNVVGVSSLPFHIIMALTAFVFAYHDLLYGAQNAVIHDGKLRDALFSSAPRPQPDQSTDPAQMLSPHVLLNTTTTISPDFKPYQLEYAGITTPRASVRIWGHNDNAIAPRAPGGFIAINPYTGEVQSTDYLPGKQGAGMTTVSSFFALHFATYGGEPVRWMYFFLGLAGAWLFYSGNLLWVENRRKRQRPDGKIFSQRKDVSAMAALTVGVCLGSVCGISLMLAASKWLSMQIDNLLMIEQWIYYSIFFASIGWAFLRGAARALVDLLHLSAILTFLIPLTSLLGLTFPATGLWMHQAPTMLAVDITAFALGCGFLMLARATSNRVYGTVSTDSVWSYTPPRYKVNSSENSINY